MKNMPRLFLLAGLLLSLASCGEKKSVEPPSLPLLDGSAPLLPLAEKVAQALTEAKGSVAAEPVFSLGDEAYLNLINGKAEVVLAAAPSAAVIEYAKNRGVDFDLVPIARDALVFLVDASFPAKDVRSEQLRGVFAGDISSWKELGGPDLPTRPRFSPFDGALNDYFLHSFMKRDQNSFPPSGSSSAGGQASDALLFPLSELEEAAAQSESYGKTEGSVTYGSYLLTAPSLSLLSSAFLTVDGVAPSDETVKNGQYPFGFTYYVAVLKSSPADGAGRAFAAYLASDDGQKLVKEAGYVPFS